VPLIGDITDTIKESTRAVCASIDGLKTSVEDVLKNQALLHQQLQQAQQRQTNINQHPIETNQPPNEVTPQLLPLNQQPLPEIAPQALPLVNQQQPPERALQNLPLANQQPLVEVTQHLLHLNQLPLSVRALQPLPLMNQQQPPGLIHHQPLLSNQPLAVPNVSHQHNPNNILPPRNHSFPNDAELIQLAKNYSVTVFCTKMIDRLFTIDEIMDRNVMGSCRSGVVKPCLNQEIVNWIKDKALTKFKMIGTKEETWKGCVKAMNEKILLKTSKHNLTF
jgi:hypothetical protein